MLVVAISLHASKTRYSQKLSQENSFSTVEKWVTQKETAKHIDALQFCTYSSRLLFYGFATCYLTGTLSMQNCASLTFRIDIGILQQGRSLLHDIIRHPINRQLPINGSLHPHKGTLHPCHIVACQSCRCRSAKITSMAVFTTNPLPFM